jgi:phytoene synthase
MAQTREDELAAHYAHCAAELRETERDLWLAALFAPAERRKHLHALHAFALEVAEVPNRVTQPLLGEMRLRWWADAIEAGSEGGARAHPVADALLDTIEACALEPGEFSRFLDAHVADLYDDPMETSAALLAYCDETEGRMLRWSAHCLGARESRAARAALGDAGAALRLLRILRRLPRGGAQFLPRDLLVRHSVASQDVAAGVDTPALRAALAELRALVRARFEAARDAQRDLDEATRIALLPAATVPLYLERMEARDYHPFAALREPSALRRQWRLWRAARSGL